MDLSSIFGKFAGREVQMVERFDRKNPNFPIVELADKNDPVIAELERVASQNGLSLRVWWPGRVGTMDVLEDRVNAYIGKNDDGKWRISGSFYLG